MSTHSSLARLSRHARATLAGAGGGLMSYFVGENVGALVDTSNRAVGATDVLLSSALWAGAIGATIGAAILIYENLASLRGQWHRDLLVGLPLFWFLSFLGGAAGQAFYFVAQNSVTRGIGWALMGAGVGIGIGALRRDMKQALRGALGGLMGGFIGGFIFNFLFLVSSAGGGSFGRLVGQIILGALIALLMRVVQEALKSAWLLGISTGPYEGKEYGLNTARVSVGRDSSNAISLFREPDLPAQLGALTFHRGEWFWQGEPVSINDESKTDAPLQAGDVLQLGATRFRFYTRSTKQAPTSVETPVAVESLPTPAPTPSSTSDLPLVPALSSTNVKPPSAPPTPSSTKPLAPVAAPIPAWALMQLSGELLRLPVGISDVRVGRASSNDLVLSDEGISSRHATLRVGSGGLEVVDDDSTNGTYVNGKRLAPGVAIPLKNGDTLRLGRLDFTVWRV